MITIADSAEISELADIEDSLRGTAIKIEEHVVIDSFVKIKPAGGSGDVRVGRGSTINSGVVILYRKRTRYWAGCTAVADSNCE